MGSADDTVPARLAHRLAVDGARPLVTFYDDATGERVELSVATFDNWVAKTANLLRDGLDVQPGARVGLLLPLHWQTVVWLVACWSAGVVAAPNATDADVLVAAPDRLEAAASAGAAEIVGLSLAPLGQPLRTAPPGVLDYAIEIPTYGDRFVPYSRPTRGERALEVHGRTFDQRDLIDSGGLRPGDRLLTMRAADTIDGVRAAIAAPVATGASVVLCRNPDERRLVSRMTAEQISAVAGEVQDVPAGVRRLG
jgi:uncharacterized protein (TIGR03089 family)